MCQNLICSILRYKKKWHTATRCTTLSFCIKVSMVSCQYYLLLI